MGEVCGGVGEVVNTMDCGSIIHGFKSRTSPQQVANIYLILILKQ